MTRFPYQVLVAQMIAALFFALPQTVQAQGMIRVADPSLCIDDMETDHGGYDDDVIAVAFDGACMIQQQDIISI